MRRFRKYQKPNYSRSTKLILIAVLVLLTAVLGYIITLEARQIKLERAGQPPTQTAQPVQTPPEGETDADAAAQEAEQAQAAQQRAEEARAARIEEG